MNPTNDKFFPMKVVTETAPSFRTYNAEGVWGTMNRSGNFQFFFYIDRMPLPKAMVFTGPGQPPSEIEFPTDNDELTVVREFQSSIVVTLEGAQQIRQIIDNFIRIAETMNKQSEAK